jgi:hypothetical protein
MQWFHSAQARLLSRPDGRYVLQVLPSGLLSSILWQRHELTTCCLDFATGATYVSM